MPFLPSTNPPPLDTANKRVQVPPDIVPPALVLDPKSGLFILITSKETFTSDVDGGIAQPFTFVRYRALMGEEIGYIHDGIYDSPKEYNYWKNAGPTTLKKAADILLAVFRNHEYNHTITKPNNINLWGFIWLERKQEQQEKKRQ